MILTIEGDLQNQNLKKQGSQPELLLHETFHLQEPLVGLLAFFGTEQGGASNHPVI